MILLVNKNKKIRNVLFFSAICIGMASLFQNCAGESSLVKKQDVSLASFFSYPYASSPKFYQSIGLFKVPSDSQNLSSFKFVGAVAYTLDEMASVQYQVTVKDTKTGVVVCPTSSGTLTGGHTTIEFDCVTSVSTDSIRVDMAVQSGSDTATMTQNF